MGRATLGGVPTRGMRSYRRAAKPRSTQGMQPEGRHGAQVIKRIRERGSAALRPGAGEQQASSRAVCLCLIVIDFIRNQRK